MFAAILYFVIFGEGLGEKVLGVWIPVLICGPICWVFGEPLSQNKRANR